MQSTVDTAMNGRESSGRFGSGNQFARGRSSRTTELRRAFTEAVTAEDLASIAQAMVKKAVGGDVQCAKLVLERCLGKVVAAQDDSENVQDENRNRVLSFIEGQSDGA